MNNTKIYYSRLEVSESIDVYKTNASKESIICHCRYSLDKKLELQPSIWDECRDILMMCMNLNDNAILNNYGFYSKKYT